MRIKPGKNGPPCPTNVRPVHFQATILAPDRAKREAFQASRFLEARGFSIQVLSEKIFKSTHADAILEAARHSSRLVIVEDGVKGKNLSSALAKALSKSAIATPIIRIGGRGNSTSAHIAETCLRNLE